jgi:hypothetical protein
MIITVITDSGSTYRLDEQRHRWVRMSQTPDSGRLLTESGIYTGYRLAMGEPLVISGPSVLYPGLDTRRVITSPVVSIVKEESSEPQAV